MSDVWANDDQVDGEITFQRHLAQQSWTHMQTAFAKTGYIDGIDEGKERTMQEGFDRGYKEGAKAAWQLHVLNGKLNAILAYFKSQSHIPDPSSDTNNVSTQSTSIQLEQNVTLLLQDMKQLTVDTIFTKSYISDANNDSTAQQKDALDIHMTTILQPLLQRYHEIEVALKQILS